MQKSESAYMKHNLQILSQEFKGGIESLQIYGFVTYM